MSSSNNIIGITLSLLEITQAAWNQAARREFLSVCVCFPTSHDASPNVILASIRDALIRLAVQRPDFAGTLQVNLASGKISLVVRHSDVMPLRTIGPSTILGYSYAELMEKHFPPGFFKFCVLPKYFEI